MLLRRIAAALIAATGLDLEATMRQALRPAKAIAPAPVSDAVEGWMVVQCAFKRIQRALGCGTQIDTVIEKDSFLLRLPLGGVAIMRRDVTLECGMVRAGDILWLHRHRPARRVGQLLLDDENLIAWRIDHEEAAAKSW